jgi:haloacid dehalogenase-like hydrolase
MMALGAGACLAASVHAQDPLPSWNPGGARDAILKFVADTTQAVGPSFVPPAERIAVFDNDGTLWSEQPMYFQLAFALARVKALAPSHPEWKNEDPFKSLLAGDLKGVLAQGEKGLVPIMIAAHSGVTTDEFEAVVKEWVTTAKYPKSGRLYTEMVYQPMLELLAHLRANGFKTFIVSGGGVEFMRSWAEKTYGIPSSSTTGPASRWGSTASSGGDPCSRSAIRTATTRCSSGRPRAAAAASWGSSTTRTRSASGPTTASLTSGSSRRRSTRRPRRAGRWST